MPPTTPSPGQTFTYNGEQLGQRIDAALLPGTVVTVREVVPAGTTGAHTDTEDSVVIEWEQEGQIIVNTTFENRGAPTLATADDGSVITDEKGQATYRMESRQVPVHEFGTGTIPRAMSVSLAHFAADFTEA